MILTDSHMHTSFSSDSTASMRSMVEAAIALGLKHITFTDHQDFDYPSASGCALFQLDKETYRDVFLDIRERYKNQIEVLWGVELGLMPHLADRISEFLEGELFDFVIGSSHLVHGKDPYSPGYFDGISDEVGYAMYFKTIAENAAAIKTYDIYGHLDYVVRFGRMKDKSYRVSDYEDDLRAGLKQIIADGKGIEINTRGLSRGLKQFHPHPDLLKLYRELGGEVITIGSDAHRPEEIAGYFALVKEGLLSLGFKYYAYYRQRKPVFISL